MDRIRNWRFIGIILSSLFLCIACDDDFNTVGSEIIKGVGFEKGTYVTSPLAYTEKIEKIQTSGLPFYYLGNYNDPTYGQLEYDFLGQIVPGTTPINFNIEPVIDSVILYLPYFSTITEAAVTEDNKPAKYSLDSIYGNLNTPFDVKIYRSNYFLSDFSTNVDNEPGERQVYLSDFIASVDNDQLTGSLLNTTETSFTVSSDAITVISEDGEDADSDPDITFLPPGLNVKLENDNLFNEILLERDDSPELSNRNNFLNYFRGLYIDFSADGNVLLPLNTQNANLTVYYKEKITDTTEIRSESLSFGFSGNNINGILETPTLEIPDANVVEGDRNLYVKGGPGSYAIIELFSKRVVVDENNEAILDEDGNFIITDDNTTNSIPEIDFLRDQNWIVNNASLRFYVDQDRLKEQGTIEPERIYVFDNETGQRLVDFCNDLAINQTGVTRHLSPLVRGTDDKGLYYDVNLTSYVNNIIQNGEDANQLGIAVSQNVTIESGSNCEPVPVAETGNQDIQVPFSSVISPEGTVLFGNTQQVPVDKRLRLTVSYSQSIRE